MIERNANGKRKRIDNIQIIVNVLFAVFLAALLFSSGWLAKNIFNYEEIREYNNIETYTEPTGEIIETFVCYTTLYGECYHSAECGSLWNSSFETTVYEAVNDGYKPCSKCEPTEKTEYIVTEIKHNVTKCVERIEKHPIIEVFVCGSSSLLALYILTTIIINKKRKDSSNEL